MSLLVVAAWFALSALDYNPDCRLFPYKTAGWFVMGLPMLLPVAAAYSALFCLVSRRTGRYPAWIAMVLVSGLLICMAVRSASPKNRLEEVVGSQATALAEIERLKVTDSFNDGLTFSGVLIGDDALLKSIVEYRGMKCTEKEVSLRFFDSRDETVADGTECSDEHSRFVKKRDSNKIFFIFHERLTIDPAARDAASASKTLPTP